jgi:hypothetical protein
VFLAVLALAVRDAGWAGGTLVEGVWVGLVDESFRASAGGANCLGSRAATRCDAAGWGRSPRLIALPAGELPDSFVDAGG